MSSMDWLGRLRLNNIFDPNQPMANDLPEQGGFGGNLTPPMFGPPGLEGGMDIPQPSVTPTSEPGYDVGGRMKELYNPSSHASQNLETLMNSYPTREKPGWLRTIAAALADYKYGPNVGMGIMNQPFEQKEREWQAKIGPAERLAQLESSTNTNERTLAYQTVSNELRQQAMDAKNAKDEREAGIRQQRADVYEFKAKNPDWKMVSTKGGNIMAINPQTGESHDTGISSGSLSEMDKLALMHENKLEEIGASGAQARETAKVRGEETRTTNTEKVKGSAAKPELPTQTRVRQFNSARQLLNTRPEFSRFIKLGNPGSNDFTITPPGKNFLGSPTGPTPEQYQEIQNAVYGAMPDIAPSHIDTKGITPPVAKPTATTGVKTPLQAGMVRVQSPDGRTGQYPRTKLSGLPKGWKVIQDK